MSWDDLERFLVEEGLSLESAHDGSSAALIRGRAWRVELRRRGAASGVVAAVGEAGRLEEAVDRAVDLWRHR